MATRFGRLAADERGFVVSTELVLIATVGVLGLITAFTCLRDAVNAELQDVAGAIGSLNQSYSYAGMHGCFRPWCGLASWTAGSAFTDLRDEQPAPQLDVGPCPTPVPRPAPQTPSAPVLPCPPAVVEPPACPPATPLPAVCLPVVVCPVLPACPPPCAQTVCPPPCPSANCGCPGTTHVSGCSSCAPVVPGPTLRGPASTHLPPPMLAPPPPPTPVAVGTLPPLAPVRIPVPGFNPIFGLQGAPPPLYW
jgi:Flp pilus assembly pilin Flp